ncbi:efflux RND transporter permease subunit [Alkalicoccus daliensis]|uniref:Multidrug efflux pump subunit AcrB n=1 Tax=Alkalicoccus daliensis TaxID=745820 RepID=A0A1H0E3E7_9BACI|nr:efflux RND transporter permease subunit [Alkalicoccus daliensis]SDN76964.1 Multidrug efflux pump subunit AcrB [Alkalicoccus daliensis]
MQLVRFFAEKKVVVILLVLTILISGVYGAGKLDRELLPAMSFDGAQIFINAGDMSSADVEKEITIPVEERLQQMEGIKQVNSSSSIGVSSMWIQTEEGEGEEVYQEIEAEINALQNTLPQVEDINMQQYSTDQPYEFFMTVHGGSMEEMSVFADDVVKTRLEALPEVREIKLDGLEQKDIEIVLDQKKLQQEELTSAQVAETLTQSDQDVSLTAAGSDTDAIRWKNKIQTVEELEKTEIISAGGNAVSLSELGEIKEEKNNLSSPGWYNGSENFVFIQAGRAEGVTQIQMAESIRAEVEKIRADGQIEGFELNELVAQADYVTDAIDGVSLNILLGGIIAVAVLFLFLRNFRATFIIGISIPISISLTFTGMWLFDYSFNILTLIGLGLGIGMMVDSSIVILESIYRKKEQGLKKLDAVTAGVKEVASAVIASMVTTIVVFLPIGLLGGEIGTFMIVLSLVVVITLVSSVIVAFTLIPSLSKSFLKLKVNQKDLKEGMAITAYGRVIQFLAGKKLYRFSVIFMFLLLFAGSLALFPKIPSTVMPDVFNRYTEMAVPVESGTTPEQREQAAVKIHEKLSKIPDVEANLIMDDIDYFYVLVNMTKGGEITVPQEEVNEAIDKELRELAADLPIDTGGDFTGAGGQPVVVEIMGEDFGELEQIASDVEERLAAVEGITGITSSSENKLQEQLIQLNTTEMERDGVQELQLLHQMQASADKLPAGTIGEGREQTDIFVRADVENLLEQEIQTAEGLKTMSNYISLEETEVPAAIDRRDGTRMITVSAGLEGRDLGAVNRDMEELLSKYEVPAGYSIDTGGSLQEQSEAMQEMMIILGIAVFLVYAVMAVQFNSFVHPLIIMSVIPLTATGALLGLLLTQSELSVLSALGMVFLIGIVLNNAILLIDRTKQLRKEGLEPKAAIMEAGKNRIRPIFMTTLTTCGGMLPLAIAADAASNYQSPLAIVIISGLLFATFITLLMIPSLYLVMEDVKAGFQKFRRKNKKEVMKAA